MPELSIVIPAYNAGLVLPKTLIDIDKYLDNRDLTAEIIVSNDGSIDTTDTLVKELIKHRLPHQAPLFLVSSPNNKGKGAAVKRGTQASHGQFILMMDADSSMPIEEIELLWPFRHEFDIVIGSRFMHGGRYRSQHLNRIIISKLGNLFFRLLFGLNIHDTQCGFKLFSRKVVAEIFPKTTISRFGFDIECLILASRKNLNVKEVPISWEESQTSSFNVFYSSWQTFWEVIRVKRKLK